jgi:large subunit ribosomal protein L30
MKQLKVKLAKSLIDEKPNTRKNARALGLRRVGATRIHKDNAVVRGMIFKVKHLVEVEEL